MPAWLAQSTTWEMINAEPPKVMLGLTTGASRSRVRELRQFECRLRTAGKMEKINIRGHECLVVYGFHPSVYLRNHYVSKRGWTPKDVVLAKNVLRHCFKQAFACLQDREVLPMKVEMLRRLQELTGPTRLFGESVGVGSFEEALENLTI